MSWFDAPTGYMPHAWTEQEKADLLAAMRSLHEREKSIPEGAMRVAPGSDAVVWKISPDHCGEL